MKAKSIEKNKSFTPQEVCEIIRQCRQDGVVELTFGDLHLSFVPKAEVINAQASEPSSTQPPDAAISADLEKQSKESVEQDALTLRQQQIDELTILNPLLAEQLIESGELEIDESEQHDE